MPPLDCQRSEAAGCRLCRLRRFAATLLLRHCRAHNHMRVRVGVVMCKQVFVDDDTVPAGLTGVHVLIDWEHGTSATLAYGLASHSWSTHHGP